MINFKKFCIFGVFGFPVFVFGQTTLDGNEQVRDFPERSFQKTEPSPLFLRSHHIITKNKILLQSLNRHFKDKIVSRKNLQQFLIRNGYYQSEIINTGTAYVIKDPVRIVFVFKGNRFFREKAIRKLIKIDENKSGAFFMVLLKQPFKMPIRDRAF